MKDLSECNDRHVGADIYVIGNGPQLNDLTNEQIKSLKKKVTIGVNYSHVFMDSTYWICGHPGHMAYAIEYASPETLKIYQKHDGRYWMEEIWKPEHNILPVLSTVFRNNEIVRRLPTPDGGRKIGIHDARQITFSTMHLAYIFGAKRIIFLGCEQNNLSHFFSYSTETVKLMKERVLYIKEKYKQYNGVQYKDISADLEDFEQKVLFNSAAQLETRSWFTDNSPIYREFFQYLNARGLETIATKQDSVIARAGAPVIPVRELL